MVLGQLHLIDMADLSHNGVANTKRSHGQVKLEPKTKEQKARTKEQIARQSLFCSLDCKVLGHGRHVGRIIYVKTQRVESTK